MSVSVEYEAFAPGAKADMKIVTPTADSDKAESYCNLSDFNRLEHFDFAFPTEDYQTLLDGTQELFRESFDKTEYISFGFVSTLISSSDGTFGDTVSITFKSESSKKHSSQGITLHFDEHNGIYANAVTVTWLDGTEVKVSKSFTPDSAVYFCKNEVLDYDGVKLEFSSMNLPFNRLHLIGVDFGCSFEFTGDMLESVNIIQEINPISSELPIGTCDIVLQAENASDYSFQKRQKLSAYHNGYVKATTYIKSYRRTGETRFEIEAVDAIGLLDDATYIGGVYSNKNAMKLAADILSTVGIDSFKYDPTFEAGRVSGYIPICSCREALMLVAFACGVAVTVEADGSIDLQKPDDTVKQTVQLDRIFQGQSFETSAVVSEVKLIAHKYKGATESTTLYEAESSGTGDGIRVEFSSPISSLKITNGTIVETNEYGGHTYAVINANDGCVLSGTGYSDTKITKSMINPDVRANDSKKVVTVETMLYDEALLNDVLSRAYNYLIKNTKTSLKIVEGKRVDEETDEIITDKPVNIGDMLTCESEYMGDITGRLISQRYSLGGGIIVKECEIK